MALITALTHKYTRRFSAFLDAHRAALASLSDPSPLWDLPLHPLSLSIAPQTNPTQPFLTPTSDVDKVLLVLAALTEQVRTLRDTATRALIPRLLLYGETTGGDEEDEGKGHLEVAAFLAPLEEVEEFVWEVGEVVEEWVAQVGALYKDSRPQVVSIAGLHLPTLFREFSDLLGVVGCVDEVVRGQGVLQDHWEKYRRMVRSVRADAASFVGQAEDLELLESRLSALERAVVSGNILLNVCDRTRSNSRALGDEFVYQLTLLAASMERDIADDELKPLSTSALFLFASRVFPAATDWKKTFNKTLLEPLKRLPGVCVGGTLLWTPESFFGGSFLQDTRSVETSRETWLRTKNAALEKEVASLSVDVAAWTARLQEIFSTEGADISRRCGIILQGVRMAALLSHSFRLQMAVSVTEGRAVRVASVAHLLALLHLLKAIQSSFFRFSIAVVTSVTAILDHVRQLAVKHMKTLQKKLDGRSEAAAAAKVLESVLRGPPSKARLAVGRLCLEWVSSTTKLWRDDEGALILRAALERMEQLVGLWERLEEVGDGGRVLLPHRVLLPTFLKEVGEEGALGLPLLALLIRDCERLVRGIEDTVGRCLVERVSAEVETELRVEAHAHLTHSPFRVNVRDWNFFLDLPPLPLSAPLPLPLNTEVYLSKTFYNLASVALHDSQTYTRMRVLAEDKHALHVLQDHLPPHSLEQGRDILEVVRNLSEFVGEFTYNLNVQVFVQLTSGNKHVDTLGIRHLSNSMRAHGPGLANTIVNAAYGFLKVKLQAVLNCLYEEEVRGRLGVRGAYAYRTAERLKRKLGEGLTRLRSLVTQIGNALGFVRLVKSGGAHLVAAASQFHLQEESLLGGWGQGEEWGAGGELGGAVKGAQDALATQATSVDYLKLLVDAFAGAYQSQSKEGTLRHFHSVIPPLTLSYVEQMRGWKESLGKKATGAGRFTDDGFPMGVAYLLRVLGQGDEWGRLAWFDVVREHFREEQRREGDLVVGAEPSLERASRLTAKRFADTLGEFQLLEYTLSSASLFFAPSL